MSGLYRGLLPSVIGMLPEAAITYGEHLLALLPSERTLLDYPEQQCFGLSASCSAQHRRAISQVFLRVALLLLKQAAKAYLPHPDAMSAADARPAAVAGLFDTLKTRYRVAHCGAEPGVAGVLSFGVASAFCGQVRCFEDDIVFELSKCATEPEFASVLNFGVASASCDQVSERCLIEVISFVLRF